MAYGNFRSEQDRDRDERWRTREGDRDPEQDPREQNPVEQYTQRDDDDSRLGRESMERDEYGGAEYGGRGGYLSLDRQDQGSLFDRGAGQGGDDPDPGRRDMGTRSDQGGEGERFGEGDQGRGSHGRGGRHYGNRTGGWPGREDEQWRNRGAHGRYDRGANYGGFSTRTGNDSGHQNQDPDDDQDPDDRSARSDTQSVARDEGEASNNRH